VARETQPEDISRIYPNPKAWLSCRHFQSKLTAVLDGQPSIWNGKRQPTLNVKPVQRRRLNVSPDLPDIIRVGLKCSHSGRCVVVEYAEMEIIYHGVQIHDCSVISLRVRLWWSRKLTWSTNKPIFSRNEPSTSYRNLSGCEGFQKCLDKGQRLHTALRHWGEWSQWTWINERQSRCARRKPFPSTTQQEAMVPWGESRHSWHAL
jgi:hypothetical protein